MKRSRILGIVLLGIVCLAGGWKIYSLRSVRSTSSPGGSSAPATFPTEGKEYQLGGVLAKRLVVPKGDHHAYMFENSQGTLTLNVTQDSSGNRNASFSYISKADYRQFASFELSDELLTRVPSGNAEVAVNEAVGIAHDALKAKIWPLKLLGAKMAIAALAARRVRLSYGMDSALYYTGLIAFDSQEFVIVPLLGHFCNEFGVIKMLEQPLILLTPEGNTVFADSPDEAAGAWKEAGRQFHRTQLEQRLLSDSNDKSVAVVNKAYGWWMKGGYQRKSVLPEGESDSYRVPWLIQGKPPLSTSRAEIEVADVNPVTINGVKIGPDEGNYVYRLKLSYDGKTVLWWPRSSVGDFVSGKNKRGGTSLLVPNRIDYPVIKMKKGEGNPKQEIEDFMTIANRLLAADTKEWPAGVWSDRLREELRSLLEGRYYLNYKASNSIFIFISEVFEGDKGAAHVYASIPNALSNKEESLELLAGSEGFSVYDQAAGCLLEIAKDGSAKLTQSPEGLAAGKKLNAAGAQALVEIALFSKEKMEIDLSGALSMLQEYLTREELPALTSGTVSIPEWTIAYREKQTSS